MTEYQSMNFKDKKIILLYQNLHSYIKKWFSDIQKYQLLFI